MKALALDFDGVISDSAPEAFVVALETWLEVGELGADVDGRMAATLDAVRAEGTYSADRVIEAPAYRAFVELMPLGNRAEDFGVVLGAIASNTLVRDQAEYDALRDSHSPNSLHAYHRRFYERRTAFSKRDPTTWQSLIAAYPVFLEILRRTPQGMVLAIATAKDRRSIRVLLREYGIDDLFPDELVLDKEAGVSKRAHLLALVDRVGVPLEELTFVDDKLNHLDDVSDLGVRCALAAWGYNSQREREGARSNGYLVCTLADFERQLFE